MVKVMPKTLKNMTMTKKLLSILLLPVMSPYPVVDAVVTIAYMLRE